MTADFQVATDAIAFAARAHQGQYRKDLRTPYVSHVCRVALVVRQLFGCDDPRVLAAAVLHDTIEDTSTDYDDLHETFGPEIAGWVALLTKNKSMPHDERERAYCRGLTDSPWQVQVCKLADVHDNLSDNKSLTEKGRRKSLDNAKRYLEAIRLSLKAEARAAWETVSELYQRKLAE